MPHRSLLSRLAALTSATVVAACATPSDAGRHDEAIMREASSALTHFEASRGLAPALQALPGVSAVMILPHVYSAAFLAGASEAEGVLFVRATDTGHWVGPVFYSLTQGSFGLQAGVSRAEVLMLINSQGALRTLLKGRPRVGIDASVAIGKGGGAGSAITTDVDSYALSSGLVAGVALDGSALRVRPDLNAAWYGRPVDPEDIILLRTGSSRDSGQLAAAIEAISR